MDSIDELIRRALGKRLLFTPHAVDQMCRPERLVTSAEVKEVLQNGKVIEDYPEDKRGHSCLVMGYSPLNRPLHVVCSPKDDYLAVVTVYIPHPSAWDSTFTKRVR